MPIKTTCVVGVIILDDKNRILLQQRGDDDHWCIPGGSMELGETVEETGIREVREETGLIVYDLKLFNVYSGESQYHKYPDGNEFYFVNVVFMTKDYEGALTIDQEETKELCFFELSALPIHMSKTNIPIMEDVKNRL